jgi:hypothetical protein
MPVWRKARSDLLPRRFHDRRSRSRKVALSVWVFADAMRGRHRRPRSWTAPLKPDVVEVDLRALGQRLEAVAGDGVVMDKHVLVACVRG